MLAPAALSYRMIIKERLAGAVNGSKGFGEEPRLFYGGHESTACAEQQEQQPDGGAPSSVGQKTEHPTAPEKWVASLKGAANISIPLPSRLRRVNQLVISLQIQFPGPPATLKT